MNTKPVIGILQGDATGIGPEIVAKLAAADFFSEYCRPLLIGDARVFVRALEQLGLQADYQVRERPEDAAWDHGMEILDLKNVDPDQVKLGVLSAVCGKACNQQIAKSVELFQASVIDGICFAPFNKSAMLMAGSGKASELEQFAALFHQTSGYGEINTVDNIWTTRVTSHIPLKAVSSHITQEKIMESIHLAYDTLIQADVKNPRIGVAALNPHAGENGKCGDEEITCIRPAVEKAVAEGINVTGPYSSDILFVKAFRGELDAAVTMYHDQGQIALKLKGFERGVTIEGGLPCPITTCAHGTAHDIAGKGIAGTTAYENALKMAATMAKGVRK